MIFFCLRFFPISHFSFNLWPTHILYIFFKMLYFKLWFDCKCLSIFLVIGPNELGGRGSSVAQVVWCQREAGAETHTLLSPIWCRCLLCNKNIYVLIAGLICISLMLSDLKSEESNKGQLKRLIWVCHVLHRNMFFFCQLNGQKVYLRRRGHPENFISLVSMNQTSKTC